MHLCNLPFPLNPFPGHRSWPITFFSSYPITCIPFLQPCLYRSPSACFQLAFSENYSTRRCIFDVFVGGGELQVLLLHHLDPLYSPLPSWPNLLQLSLWFTTYHPRWLPGFSLNIPTTLPSQGICICHSPICQRSCFRYLFMAWSFTSFISLLGCHLLWGLP